jgi:hypothetical protein
MGRPQGFRKLRPGFERKFIADTMNDELAAEGKADIARVEYRSFKDRVSSQKPTQQHQGPGKTHALRKKLGQARKEAVTHRQALDRTAEVHARTSEARSISREQQQDREQGRGRSISPDDLTPP